ATGQPAAGARGRVPQLLRVQVHASSRGEEALPLFRGLRSAEHDAARLRLRYEFSQGRRRAVYGGARSWLVENEIRHPDEILECDRERRYVARALPHEGNIRVPRED